MFIPAINSACPLLGTARLTMGMRALCTLIVAMSGARTQENIDLHQKPANVRALRKSAHPEPTTYAIFANGVRQRVDTISHEAELDGSHNQVGDILVLHHWG